MTVRGAREWADTARQAEESKKADLRARGLCENPYCEDHGSAAPQVRITVTWPRAAARANAPENLCATCAGEFARSFIGFGWGIRADRITRAGKVRS